MYVCRNGEAAIVAVVVAVVLIIACKLVEEW